MEKIGKFKDNDFKETMNNFSSEDLANLVKLAIFNNPLENKVKDEIVNNILKGTDE